jgi:hypothetical protein
MKRNNSLPVVNSCNKYTCGKEVRAFRMKSGAKALVENDEVRSCSGVPMFKKYLEAYLKIVGG